MRTLAEIGGAVTGSAADGKWKSYFCLARRWPIVCAVIFGGGSGALAWSGSVPALAIAPLGVLLWSRQATRGHGASVILAYYLMAAWGLPVGAAQFYGEYLPIALPVALWLGASLLLSLPWWLMWGHGGFYWRVPIALILCIVPPIGLVGWANPVTAAGLFFTAMGWFGLVAMVCAIVALCYWPWSTAVALAFSAFTGAIGDVPALTWIRAVDTSYGGSGFGERDFAQDYHANQNLIRRALEAETPVTVFPESVAGRWSPTTEALWADASQRLRHKGQSVLVGTEIPVAGTGKYHNALIVIGAQRGQWIQRIPVPFAMWRPWSGEGASANPIGNGTGLLNGQRTAVFICYEQLLVWPMLLSQAASPELIIGAGNSYWASGTNLAAIQRATLAAWARLYGQPVVTAFNY